MDNILATFAISTKPSNCERLEHPNPLTTALAAFILVGILVSYLPQHIKIIARRSSEGLSPWWVLLGGLGSIAAMGCIMVLPASRADLGCCREISGGACAAALLGVLQIGVQWSCFMFIVFLFCIFFPAHPSEDLSSSIPSLMHDPIADQPPQISHAVIVGGTTILSLFIVSIVSIALVFALPDLTQAWADILGVLAGCLSAVQYIPQIYYTWKLGDVKSLSLLTMLIQVPGAFLFALSLWLRVGWEGWGTWLIYVITGVLQAMLFAIALYYTFFQRKAYQEDSGYSSEVDGAHNAGDTRSIPEIEEAQIATAEAGERTALLGNHKSGAKTKSIAKDGNRVDSYRSTSSRNFDMLYAATPPDQDSDASESARHHFKKKKGRAK